MAAANPALKPKEDTSNEVAKFKSLLQETLCLGVTHGMSLVNLSVRAQQKKLRHEAANMSVNLFEARMEVLDAFCAEQKAIGKLFAFNNGLDWNYILRKVERDFFRYELFWDSENLCWKN